MKGSVIVCLLPAFGGLLVAHEVAKADLFLGYSFVRYNPTSNSYSSSPPRLTIFSECEYRSDEQKQSVPGVTH